MGHLESPVSDASQGLCDLHGCFVNPTPQLCAEQKWTIHQIYHLKHAYMTVSIDWSFRRESVQCRDTGLELPVIIVGVWAEVMSQH